MKKLTDALFTENRITNFTAIIIKSRYLIFSLALLLSVFSFRLVSDLHIDSSIMALLPKNTPSIKRINELEKKTGGFGDVIIMIESPDSDMNIAYAEKLLPEIRKRPWVDRAQYRLNDTVFNRNKLLFLDVTDLEDIQDRLNTFIAKKQGTYNPLLVDLLEDEEDTDLDFSDIEKKYAGANNIRKINLSDDGQMLLLVIHPRGITSDISFAKSILSQTRQIVDTYDTLARENRITVRIGGTYSNRLGEYWSVVQNVRSSLMAGGIIIAIMLLVYFRRVSYVVCLLVPLFMSLLWTFAITAVTIKSLNLITAFLIMVLFGLGIDIGIHILSRYSAMRKNKHDHNRSLVTSLQNEGRACLTASLTTSCAFYILMFSNFLGFRHFGFIAGTGVLMAYFSYIILLPALLTFVNDLQKMIKPKINFIDIEATVGTSGKPFWPKGQAMPRSVLLVCVALTLVCLWNSRKLSFEGDFRNLRAKLPDTREFNAQAAKVFKAARDPAVVLVADEKEAKDILHYLSNNNLLSDESPVEEVKSIFTIVPDNQGEKLHVIRNIEELYHKCEPYISEENRSRFEELSILLIDSAITLKDIPKEIATLFVGFPGTEGQLLYLYQRNSLLNLTAAREFSEAVGTIEIDGKEFYAVSEPLVYLDLLRLVERDSIIAILAAFIIIFLLIYFDFGTLWSTSLVLINLIIGIVWMIGCMGFFTIKLNIFNLVIFPSIIGLAVDSAIHIRHRFEEHGVAVYRAGVLETEKAVTLSTLTTLVSFGSFFFGRNPHPGLQSLGLVAIIGMSACLAASLSFLPAIILSKRR